MNVIDYTKHRSKPDKIANGAGGEKNGKQALGYSSTIADKLKKHISFLLVFLEASIHLKSKDYSSCISLLTSNLSDSKSKIIKRDFYIFNSLGCCHLELAKPNLAITYFKKGLAESQRMQQEKKSQLSETRAETSYKQKVKANNMFLVYNIGLSYYMSEQWSKAIGVFARLKHCQTSNYMFWYRFGVAYFKLAIQAIKERLNPIKNDLYSHVKDRKEPLSKSSDKRLDELKRYYLSVDSLKTWKNSESIKEKLANALE